MTNVQFMSSTSPCSWEYMKEPKTVDKILELTTPRSPCMKWSKPSPKKKKPKNDPEVALGPGIYNPFGEISPKDYKKVKLNILTEKRSISAFFPKSKAPSALDAASKANKYSACVGMYDIRREDELRRDKANVKASTAPFQVNEKRVENKPPKKPDKITPGPGAYEILPPMEYDIKPGKKKA